MTDLLSLTVPQTLFTAFFAIFWGASANAQPRWRAFAWPYAKDPKDRKRLRSSVLVMNVLPLVYFVLALSALSSAPWRMRTWAWPAPLQAFGAVVPAFAAFAFYRLWLGWLQRDASKYYRLKDGEVDKTLYPGLTPNDLDKDWSAGNLKAAAGYLIVSAAPLLIAFLVCVL